MDSFDHSRDLTERYRETLYRFPALAFYGVYRSAAVRKTKLLQRSIATDLAFIQELSLFGHFIQVPRVLFIYHGRTAWNTVEQDYRTVVGGSKKPWWYLPFAVLFADHCKRVIRSDLSAFTKVPLLGALLLHQARQIALKVPLKVAGRVCPPRLKEKLASYIYWRWMRNPNVVVGDPDLYLERVIKPVVGWWR